MGNADILASLETGGGGFEPIPNMYTGISRYVCTVLMIALSLTLYYSWT